MKRLEDRSAPDVDAKPVRPLSMWGVYLKRWADPDKGRDDIGALGYFARSAFWFAFALMGLPLAAASALVARVANLEIETGIDLMLWVVGAWCALAFSFMATRDKPVGVFWIVALIERLFVLRARKL